MSRQHTIHIESVRIDGDTQSRVAIDQDHIEDIRAAIRAKMDLPPLVVYFDGKDHWLVDGFHRYHAFRAEGATSAPVEFRKGTKRDAKLHAAGANAGHGLKRTNADKRRAVRMLLDDADWQKWSNRRIAEHCGVSDPFVAELRSQLRTVSSCRIGRDGKVRAVPTPNPKPSPATTTPPPPPDDTPSPDDEDAGEIAPGAKPSELTDRAGFPIPRRLQTVFANRDLIALAVVIGSCKQRAQELAGSDVGRRLNPTRIVTELENARKAVLFAQPYAVCPFCAAGRGRGNGCRTCGDTGWLTREMWATVPEELKK